MVFRYRIRVVHPGFIGKEAEEASSYPGRRNRRKTIHPGSPAYPPVFWQDFTAGRMDFVHHAASLQFIESMDDILLEAVPFFLQPGENQIKRVLRGPGW
jgi:hypothetical protein